MEHSDSNSLDQHYWDNRYEQGQTGWDIGYASPPLTNYFDQLTNKDLRILIPGCGNAYEGVYLHEKGFTDVNLLDMSGLAMERFSKKYPEFPGDHLILSDFFTHDRKYDLIVEQTFFCALAPSLRADYARHCADLLNPGGKLIGVLFDRIFEKPGPPFGGSRADYLPLFGPYFEVEVFAPATNSIPPRAGSELFIILEKLQVHTTYSKGSQNSGL